MKKERKYFQEEFDRITKYEIAPYSKEVQKQLNALKQEEEEYVTELLAKQEQEQKELEEEYERGEIRPLTPQELIESDRRRLREQLKKKQKEDAQRVPQLQAGIKQLINALCGDYTYGTYEERVHDIIRDSRKWFEDMMIDL
jgi:exonuclease VII large subunit